MRNGFLVFIMLIFLIPVEAQIIITETDMPKEGDTLRVSLTTNIPGNYTQAGPDMTWNFSSLNRMSQQVNSYVSIQTIPPLYWFTFIPGIVSNLASPANNLPSFPGIPVSNFFTFYMKSASSFSDVGFAFQLSGIPISLKYDSPDVYYEFPCTMGSTWSSNSFAAISIPGLAYFSSSRTRTSQVDAWGNLTTPFGTFQTIRIKSEVVERDSIYLDTLSGGLPYTRNITEYKWLGKGQGIPLLQINEEGLVKTAIYRDNVGNTGINEPRKASVLVFPNPTDGGFAIHKGEIRLPAHLQILNIQGNIVFEQELPFSADKTVSMNVASLSSGLYMIKLISKEIIYTGKVVIIR
jgi:hypothetical protein